MKAILALGNPGERYRDTRHNVAWWLADRLVASWKFPPFRREGRVVATGGRVGEFAVEIRKPLTYVNRSGRVARDLRERGIDPEADLLVLVDDVWLDPGTLRLRARGSSGGHNGLSSIQAALASESYGRLRIGVGRPHDERIDLAEWVLAPLPAADEEKVLTAFDRAVEAVECWLEDGMEVAMNRFNR